MAPPTSVPIQTMFTFSVVRGVIKYHIRISVFENLSEYNTNSAVIGSKLKTCSYVHETDELPEGNM